MTFLLNPYRFGGGGGGPFGGHATLTDAIAHWRFNDDMTDAIGSHDWSAAGTPTYATGVLGNALTLNQDREGYIADHADFKPSGDWSYTFWIKATDTGLLTRYLNKRSTLSDGFLFSTTNASQWELGVSDGTNEKVTVSASSDFGVWRFVYIEYDDTAKKIGFSIDNGTLNQTAALSGSMVWSTSELELAGDSNANAVVDSMTFFHRKLTSGELTDLFAGLDY